MGRYRHDSVGSHRDGHPQPHQRIWVDADACPRSVRQLLHRLQKGFNFRLITVASFHHDLEPGDGGAEGAGLAREHITVGDGPDTADLAIANRLRRGDIVVTQDWGLAALALAKGGRAVTPRGIAFTPERIDFQLEERALKAKVRRGGGRHRGPKPHTPADDRRLEEVLREWLQSDG